MVVIRLARGGAKKRPFYNIVVADSHFAATGRFIERIGFYDPKAPAGREASASTASGSPTGPARARSSRRPSRGWSSRVPSPQPPPSNLLVMGRVAAPFGVKGWVKITPFTESPATLCAAPPAVDRPAGRVARGCGGGGHGARRVGRGEARRLRRPRCGGPPEGRRARGAARGAARGGAGRVLLGRPRRPGRGERERRAARQGAGAVLDRRERRAAWSARGRASG